MQPSSLFAEHPNGEDNVNKIIIIIDKQFVLKFVLVIEFTRRLEAEISMMYG